MDTIHTRVHSAGYSGLAVYRVHSAGYSGLAVYRVHSAGYSGLAVYRVQLLLSSKEYFIIITLTRVKKHCISCKLFPFVFLPVFIFIFIINLY